MTKLNDRIHSQVMTYATWYFQSRIDREANLWDSGYFMLGFDDVTSMIDGMCCALLRGSQ